MFINALLIIVVVLLVLAMISPIIFLWSRVPYVPTKWPVVREMVKLADLEPGQNVYDLGAGDGRLLIEAKKVQPDIQATGVEILPSVCLLSKWRQFRTGTKITMQCGNMFNEDLGDADVVFVYLFPEVVEKLEKKFDVELKPGTKVISHAFACKSKRPTFETSVAVGKKEVRVFVYHW